jgi:hypothetical protein
LNPDIHNTYRVGVDYYITGDDLNYDTRCYTEIKASTLALGASPTPTLGPTPSAVAESGLQPQTQGTPGWLFAVLGVTGASALGAVSYVLIRRAKKTKE